MNNEDQLILNLKKSLFDHSISKVFNVLVLGPDNVGKSSLIEYISGVNIFPQDQDIYKINLNLKLINNKKQVGKDTKAEVMSEEINQDLITINNEMFTSWEKFHSYLTSNRDKVKDLEQVKVKLSSKHSNLSFNYSFSEISDKTLFSDCKDNYMIKMLLEDVNCIFIVCIDSNDSVNECRKYQDIISEYDVNSSKTIFIFNKCDLANLKDEKLIKEIMQIENIVLMINRSKERRLIEFPKFTNIEKEFFINTNHELRSGIKDLEIMLDKITINILKNNQMKNNDINLIKQKKPNKSKNIHTPSQNKRSLISKSSLNTTNWREKIRRIIESSYNGVIYFLERDIKKIKYTNAEEYEKLNLICEINRIIQKNNFSMDFNRKSYDLLNLDYLKQCSTDKKSKLNTLLNEMISKIIEEQTQNLKTAFSIDYQEIISQINKLLEEIYGRNNKEMIINSLIKFKNIAFKGFTEYEKINNIIIEREQNLIYCNDESIYKSYEELFSVIDKDNYEMKDTNIKMINQYVDRLVNYNLQRISESICKNYSYYFLLKFKESLENHKDDQLESSENISMKLNQKVFSVSFPKHSSLKSKDTFLKKYLVYESSQNKDFSQGTNSNKSKSKVNSNKLNEVLAKDSNNSFKMKLIPSFEIEDKEDQDEIVMVWDTTYNITVFDYRTNKITKEAVNNIPNNQFLENNRFLNIPHRVFVSGGLYNNNCTSLFFVIERKSNKIRRLHSMPVAVTRHSLIYLKVDTILLAGGTGNKGCFNYFIQSDKWEKVNSLNYEREDGSLFCFNEMLFIFGGRLNLKPNLINTVIEYTYIDDRKKTHWNIIDLSVNVPEDNLLFLLRISGSGIIIPEVSSNKIFICGGYNNESMEEANYVYELIIHEDKNQSRFCELNKRTDLHLIYPSWFCEAIFSCDRKKYYNYDIDGNLHSFSLNMEKFFFEKYDYEI